MPKIHSRIEVIHGRSNAMPKNRRNRSGKEEEPLDEISDSDSEIASKPNRYKSEASSDKHRFFNRVQTGNQTVNVRVNVQPPQDSCVTACFSGLAKCFGRGAAS